MARVDAGSTRAAASPTRDHDHVGRQQPALRRARRDRDLRTAEGRAPRGHRGHRCDARPLCGVGGARGRRSAAAQVAGRGRGRRPGLRAAARRRIVPLGRRGRGGPDRPRRARSKRRDLGVHRRRPHRPRRRCSAKAPFVVAERARAAGVPITLLSGAVDAAALPELGQVYSGCFALPSGPMTLADCIAGAGGAHRRPHRADRARLGGGTRLDAARNARHHIAPGRNSRPGFASRQEGRPFRPSARSGAPGVPAADRSRSAPRSSRCGRRVTRASAAGSIATTRASASASIFCACSTDAKELRAVADAGRGVRAGATASRPQEREDRGVLGQVLRNAQRFRTPRDLVSPRSRRSGSALSAASRRGSRDVREQRRVETVRLARPERPGSDGSAQPGPTGGKPRKPAGRIDGHGVRVQRTRGSAEAAAETALQLPSCPTDWRESGAESVGEPRGKPHLHRLHPCRERQSARRAPRAIQRRTSSALSASNSTWPAAARASAPKTAATVAASRGVELACAAAPFR